MSHIGSKWKASARIASVTLASTALLMLLLGLRGSAGPEPKAPASDIGFAIARGTFEVVVATSGVIQPLEVVDVGAQVSGQLAKLHVKLGDRVEPGQLLAEIDDRLIRARLVQGEATIENIRAQIQAKHAQLLYARAQQNRTNLLVERSIATRVQADLAQSTSNVLEAEARALEAQLTAQSAVLDGIRLDLGYARIAAPVEGVVTAIVAQRGQTLNASQQAPVILRISRDNPLLLVARVPEADAERVRPGMPIRFALLGGSSRKFEGFINSVLRAPTIVNDVVFYDAIVVLDGEQEVLAFGRTVQVFIVVDRLSCAFIFQRRSLPEDAAPGGMIKIRLRKQGGNIITRIVQLRALNEVSGAVPCTQGEKAGLDVTDRVLKIIADHRAGS